jgi:glutamyl-tRNA synthetase
VLFVLFVVALLDENRTAPVVGRLAPSPTGAQHAGNARTYLIAWLAARSRGGRVVLRIEDIDSPRVKPGAAEGACDDLRWLGLDWDEGPVVQTERLADYQAALARLQARELVYPCTCTRSDVGRAASAPHADHEGPVYPGTCAGRRAADAAALGERPFCWRFRVPPSSPAFVDGFRGPTAIDLRSVGGDFVVWKAPRAAGEPAAPAYQLAVVVDDAAQGVTEVVRGDDLVPSTPRQLLLYEALGLRPPSFTHMPLVVGPDGRRLAKRHGDTRLAALRRAGVRAEALLGLLAWSCGWIPRVGPVGARDLLPLFRLGTIPPGPFVLTPDLLRAIGYG